MANPSEEGPSGVGTEVLRRKWFQGIDHSANNVLIDGDANHIYTVISIVCNNGSTTDTGFNLYLYPNATSGSLIYILIGDDGGTRIPKHSTFVFNDKLVITGTDELYCNAQTGGGGNLDVWITYIDQQFAAP